MKTETADYQKQATDFLEAFGLRFRAVNLYGDRCPTWGTSVIRKSNCSCGQVHGDHYRVTIRGASRSLTFSFWGSLNDRQNGEKLTAYSVLSSIGRDVWCADTFEDFCSDHGYDLDSRKAFAIFKRCVAFAPRLRAFFTEAEIESLQEIQ